MVSPWQGAIVETGIDEEPFVFQTVDDCAVAWVQFHEIYGVPMTPEEYDLLLIDPPEENDQGVEL